MQIRTPIFAAIALLLFSALSASATPAVTATDLGGHAVRPLAAAKSPARVFLFVATDCPLCEKYVPEINRLCADYGPRGAAFSVVYVDAGLTPAQAQAHFARRGFRCAGLVDTRHLLVTRLGATATPEAVVVGPTGGVLYRGRIDNRVLAWGVTHDPNVADLRAALDAVLAHQPIPAPWHKAIGCGIPALPNIP